MHLDEPFPLDAFPSRVKVTILNEFKGRYPSVREVAEIPDSHWLSTPAIGPAHLEKIRSVTDALPQQTPRPSLARLSDVELLDRLEWLQEELRWLHDQVKAKLTKSARRKPNCQWHKNATQDEADRQKVPPDTARHVSSVP